MTNVQAVDVGMLAVLMALAIAAALIAGVLLGYGLGVGATKARYHAAMRRAWRRRRRRLEDLAVGGDADAQVFLGLVPERMVDQAARRELEQALAAPREFELAKPWGSDRRGW